MRRRCGLSVAHPTEPSTRPAAQRVLSRAHSETAGMKRLSMIALQVTVLAAFVLTLAAPFRWWG